MSLSIKKVLDIVIKVIEWACMISFGVMIILVGLQVVMRFVAKNAFDMSWSEEAVRFLLCWMVFLGAVIIYESHGHVWVANLVDFVPKPVRRGMLFISYVIQICFFISIFVGTAIYFPVISTQYSNMLHIPLTIVYCVIPITGAVSLIFCIRDLIGIVTGKADGDTAAG